MNKGKRWISIVLCVVTMMIAGIAVVLLVRDDVEVENVTPDDTENSSYIMYEGEKYQYNTSLRNVLFIGVDQEEGLEERSSGQGGQADTLLLVSMNSETQEMSVLAISRDTIVPVRVYDNNGNFLEEKEAQITLQYAYGDGKELSCIRVKDAVSKLLYDIPIHSYMAMSVNGISKVVDLMGGMDYVIPEDYTDIDARFQKGECIKMDGEMAERYVRYRDTQVEGSNRDRMKRQTEFMTSFVAQMQGRELGWYQNLFVQLEGELLTDMSLDEMEKLSEYQMNSEVQSLPGEIVQGELYEEFHADDKKIKQMIIKTFYKIIE